jgi:hypothetical protein
MKLGNTVNASLRRYLAYRYARVEAIRQSPLQLQNKTFRQLISKGQKTKYGKLHHFELIRSEEDFTSLCPLNDYHSLKSYIYRHMDGEAHVLWPGKIRYFSKSAGTTQEQCKYLPVSWELLHQNLRSSSWDAVASLYHYKPDSAILKRKNLLMGGSLKPWKNNPHALVGDVSAIMVSNIPAFTRSWYAPDMKIALLPNFEEKLELMAKALLTEDLFLLAGVPTWTVVLFEKMLELSGKSHMHEIWPNAEVYFHGGIGFEPYKKQFADYLPDKPVEYREVYNASEGYFGFQDRPMADDLLLLCGNGIYYEFIPLSETDKENPEIIPLEEVVENQQYEIVISTLAGLWRYRIGDTIQFSSTRPYRFKITGRTKQCINVFGEEVMIGDTDKAIAEVCNLLDAHVKEYTVAPIFMNKKEKGGHEWIIEFAKEPKDLLLFEDLLDKSLQQINADYQAKRFKNLALENLKVHSVPRGSFRNWLKAKGKLGGQNKVPRLSEKRKYLEEILFNVEM